MYFPALDRLFRSHADLIRVAEIEPQTLWVKGSGAGDAPRGSAAQLGGLATLPQSKLLHGIGNPVGGTICDQQVHVGEFRRWSDRLCAPWTSEHLSLLDVEGRTGPQSCGFLMPPSQTEAQVELTADNIRRRRGTTGRPFAFETGVNYFAPRQGEMPDGEFFAAVAEAADCGILLDLNNLWVNQKNGRATIDEVLADLPMDRVWEVHLAGAEFAHGFWLDAHCGALDPELAAIAAEVACDLSNLGAIIFEVAPDRLATFSDNDFLRQMEMLQDLWEGAGSGSRPRARRHADASTPGDNAAAPAAWERLIASRMLPAGERPVGSMDLHLTASDERSFELYASLVTSFRRGAIADLLQNSIRLLLAEIGASAVEALLDAYIADFPPRLFPSDEALAFTRFMGPRGYLAPGLADMLRFESAVIEAIVDDRTVQVALKSDDGSSRIWEIGADTEPFVREIAPAGEGRAATAPSTS
jgi:uncharacterized protein